MKNQRGVISLTVAIVIALVAVLMLVAAVVYVKHDQENGNTNTITPTTNTVVNQNTNVATNSEKNTNADTLVNSSYNTNTVPVEYTDQELTDYLSECEARVSGTAWDEPYYCYTEAAVTEYHSMLVCGEIPTDEPDGLTQQLECYNEFAAMASLHDDTSICDQLPDTTSALERIKVSCYGGVAYAEGSSGMDVCNALVATRKFTDTSYLDGCLTNVAYQCTIYWVYRIGTGSNTAPAACQALMDQTGWSKDMLSEKADEWF